MSLLSIILFIVSLGVLVTIHEIGHFTMAKLFNVYCHEFAVGFGPKIYSKKKGETTYSIRAIPLGGYVMMHGEDVTYDDKDLNIPKERSILGIKRWKRAIVMFAGIFLNFVLAFVLFFCNNAFFPQREYTNTNQLMVAEKEKAYLAGMRSGDTVINIVKTCTIENNDKACEAVKDSGVISTYEEMWNALTYPSLPKTENDVMNLTILYQTDGITKQADFSIKPVKSGNEFEWGKIGIGSYFINVRYGFSKAVSQSGRDWVEGSTTIAKTLGGLFVGEHWDEIGGPVSILTQSSEVLAISFGYYLMLWGLISVNLAIFNLLPFPGLDGWHLFVIAVEGTTRKEIPAKVKNVVSVIGILLLFGLMIFVTGRDILRLF